MRYNFDNMDADSFELMIRSLNMKIFGVKCDQYGLGPDGQREFVFNGEITDMAGNVFKGRTIGQVKYKYPVTREDDYHWLIKEIEGELERFRMKEPEFIPDNYLFYTNVVLTPMKDKGIKDKIDKYLKENNDIIPNFLVRGYDEICALLDNNRDVATCYASHILPGDALMTFLKENTYDYSSIMQKYLARELEEDMYTRLEQAGSVTEKKISIEKVCVDIDVTDREEQETLKFAEKVLELGNCILGYRKKGSQLLDAAPAALERNENFVLIGGPGRGKTTICQFIAQIYRANYLYETNYHDIYSANFMQELKQNYGYAIHCKRIPFMITLREYAAWIRRQGADDDVSIVRYMQSRIKKIEGEELSVKALREMLGQLSWIFFFDGLDEVPESSNRGEVLKQIELFINTELREAVCDCMIISTTRMQGYNNDFDEEKYKHLEVAELSKEDCRKYVKKLFGVMEEQTDKREEYLEIIQEALEDDTTSRLMKTPLQATIISILVKSGGKPPHERYSLFKQYYETMVKREKQKGIIATLNANTDWLEEIHLQIADRLQRESEQNGNPSAEISSAELEQAIAVYIDQNKDEFYEKNEELGQKTKDFLKIITQRICFLCENREGFYSFSIRTMQEYFAGTYIVKGARDEDIIKNINEIAYKAYWRNVLLFALGYIELEKKALETEISNLCYAMNGRDHLTREEYDGDNICLFGSWLAVDILTEDIFKGTKQNKYIELAAKTVEIHNCTNFYKFSLVTGVQCDKLKGYVKDHYLKEKKCIEGVLALYMKLSENEKNHLEQSVDELLEVCTEEQKIQSCIQLMKEGIGFDEPFMEKWEQFLVQAIIEGKVKQFLPARVVSLLLQKYALTEELSLKGFLLIQCLFVKNISYMKTNRIFGLEERVFRNLCGWLSRDTYDLNPSELEVVDGFDLYICTMLPPKDNLITFQKLVRELKLDVLVKLCDYGLHQSYASYTQLANTLSRENDWIAEALKQGILYGMENLTEAKYQELQSAEAETKRLFASGDIEGLLKSNRCHGLRCMVSHRPHILDEIVEQSPFHAERICELGDVFLSNYMFIARVQVMCYRKVSELSEKTAGYILTIMEEMQKREMYSYQTSIVLTLLLASDYRGELYRRVPEVCIDEQILDMEMRDISTLRERHKFVNNDVIGKAVKHIIQRADSQQSEISYLKFLPLLLESASHPTMYVNEFELKELEKIDFQNDWSKLAVLLTAMCLRENGDVQTILRKLLQLQIPRVTIYAITINILIRCDVKNAEMLMVALYLALEQEEFEERQEMRTRLLNRMYENRCDGD